MSLKKIAVTLQQLETAAMKLRSKPYFFRAKGKRPTGRMDHSDPKVPIVEVKGNLTRLLPKQSEKPLHPRTQRAMNALMTLHEGRERRQFLRYRRPNAARRVSSANRGGQHYNQSAWLPDLNIGATFTDPNPVVEKEVKEGVRLLRQDEVNIYSNLMPQHAQTLQGALQGRRISKNKIRNIDKDWKTYVDTEKRVESRLRAERKAAARKEYRELQKKKRGQSFSLEELSGIRKKEQELMNTMTGGLNSLPDVSQLKSATLKELGWGS